MVEPDRKPQNLRCSSHAASTLPPAAPRSGTPQPTASESQATLPLARSRSRRAGTSLGQSRRLAWLRQTAEGAAPGARVVVRASGTVVARIHERARVGRCPPPEPLGGLRARRISGRWLLSIRKTGQSLRTIHVHSKDFMAVQEHMSVTIAKAMLSDVRVPTLFVCRRGSCSCVTRSKG